MNRFLRSRPLRNALWIAADGKCQRCGVALPDDWHADHITPWVQTRDTNVHDMQALCPDCNLKKGSTVKPRRFQLAAKNLATQMAAMSAVARRHVVAHVFPGGGKSSLPVIFGSVLKKAGLIDKICVVVPRLSLRKQNAEAFTSPLMRDWLGHRMEVNEAGNDVNPSRGTDGYVTTYQTLAVDSAGLHAEEFRRHRYLLCLDEVHHVGLDGDWHRATQKLFSRSAFQLSMTGTLDKNEGGRIAYLNYGSPGGDGVLVPDVSLSYPLVEATNEHAVIRICFPSMDGQVSYLDRNGRQVTEFTLGGSEAEARDKILVAINTEYAVQLLTRCVTDWRAYRAHNPRSQMLVVCYSVEQAKKMLKVLKDLNVSAAIAVSKGDDGDVAQETITKFRRGTPDALVTVQMAYEGLDVPALTHLACLTRIRSMPWLMQMFGRVMRYDHEAGPWSSQQAFAFVPDDPLMQKAVDYLRDGQPIGVTAEDFEDEESDDGGGESSRSEPVTADVIPLNGQVTRERIVGIDPNDSLSHQQTALAKEIMSRHNLHGNPADLLRAIAEIQGAAPKPLPAQPKPAAQPASPKERSDALKRGIQSMLLRIDASRNLEPGTMNRMAFQQVQGGKPRNEMTEDELRRVWTWAQEQMSKYGVSDK